MERTLTDNPNSYLTLGDCVRFALFCSTVGLVYVLSLAWCSERVRRKPPKTVFARFFQAKSTGVCLLSVAVFGIGCFAYGILIEPNRLTVTTYTIETAKFPAGERVRLVQLADLHVRAKGPRERALPDLVRSLQPDVILHTGDFYAWQRGVTPIVQELLRSWNVPQFACAGNFEVVDDLNGVLREAGVMLLNRTRVIERIRKCRLCITGFPCGDESGMPACLRTLPADTFNIVLYHRPQGFPKTWDTPADLMLAGHTHGGQIRLPGFGAIITLDAYGKRWESGFFDEHGVKLIVSRGIGGEPYVPEMRFCCPPEVVVIDLIGTGKNDSG